MIKRVLIALFAATVLSFITSACSTVHGAGEDISSMGDKIQDSVR